MRGRVRWRNVGRVVAAVAVVALVVAWPRLDGGPLEVPGGAAVPVAPTPAGDAGARREAAPPPAAAEPGERARRHGRSVTESELRAPSPAAPRPKARRERRGRRAAPPSGAPAPAATPRAVAPAPPPAVAPDPNPAPPPAATVDPAEREFGFER